MFSSDSVYHKYMLRNDFGNAYTNYKKILFTYPGGRRFVIHYCRVDKAYKVRKSH